MTFLWKQHDNLMSVTTEQEDGSDSVGIGALRFAEKASSFQEVSNFLA
jgi:hypothetical protein